MKTATNRSKETAFERPTLPRHTGIVRPIAHIGCMTPLTIWYDDACPLCRREIALMQRLDRRRVIRFVDVSGSADAACPIDRTDLLARFHARENGQLLSGAAAFAAMWRAIPLLRPLGLAARWRPFLWLLEQAYRAFLHLRPRLQRLAAQLEPA